MGPRSEQIRELYRTRSCLRSYYEAKHRTKLIANSPAKHRTKLIANSPAKHRTEHITNSIAKRSHKRLIIARLLLRRQKRRKSDIIGNGGSDPENVVMRCVSNDLAAL